MINTNAAVKQMNNVSFNMTNAEYWIKQSESSLEIRMDASQIRQLNAKNLEKLAAQHILYPLEQLSGVKAYGICVRRGMLWDSLDAKKPLTAVYVNEPVAVLEEHQDWYQVCCVYYKGWIHKECVALCDGLKEWRDVCAMEHFVIVTADYITLPHVREVPELSELRLDMGVRLELASPRNIQGSYYNYIVKIPVRQRDGRLKHITTGLPMCKDIHIGYLEYTGANVLRQAFKTLGNVYGWGGICCARDCSALVMDIHRCFGMILPRDVAGQMQVIGSTPTGGDVIPEVGDVMGFPGHTMIYLGYHKNHYVISAVGSFYVVDEKDSLRQVRADSCVVSELTLVRANGLTWEESLSYLLKIYKT